MSGTFGTADTNGGTFGISIAGLQKSYGKRTVLDIAELSVTSGRAYALVGPNGSGKSTLLRVLAGIEDATAGSIDVTGDATREGLTVGYMPQKSYAFGFSVFRNVAIALESRHLAKDEVQRRVNAALAAVGMAEMAEARGHGLSGGEAQRVALARMLVQDLDVLLLDEPTASMDVSGTMLVEQALGDYLERRHCLALIATHAPSQARRIADEVIMLAGGHVVERGATNTVLSSPTSEEGRAFLSYWAV